ncbi:MAG: hypothetical protein GF331_19265 [Chitinivibrionales bacterium]|nr:hypothetical protein [Chitinivibrionales bacterium]
MQPRATSVLRRVLLVPFIGLIPAAGLITGVHAAIEAEILVTPAEVEAFCGTRNVKAVFVNKESTTKLHYVDFSAGTPSIVEVANTDGAILPSISPDGEWVLYSKGPDADGRGMPPSSAYLSRFDPNATQTLVKENTAFEPRFVPNAPEMTIIYADTNGSNTWDGFGNTVKLPVPGGVPGTEEIVWDGGAYIGGISKDNRYLCTGLPRAVIVDLQAGTVTPPLHALQLHSHTSDSTIPYSSCITDPSISQSTIYTDLMMYVDFGLPSTSYPDLDVYVPGINNDSQWVQHEIIFITRSDGQNVCHYVVPNTGSGIYDTPAEWDSRTTIRTDVQWNDPEWSNHPYYAAAAAQVHRAYHNNPAFSTTWGHTYKNEVLFILNLKDSTYLPILRTTNVTATTPTNMLWPGVWIEIPADFREEGLDADPRDGRAPRLRSAPGALKLTLDGYVLTSAQPVREVTMYNMLGAVMRRIEFGSRGATTVGLRHVPAGVYFVRAQSVSGEREVVRWTVAR